MGLNLPEKKLVASLLEEHQTIAFEIRIDRIDLYLEKLIDVEEIVLWVQVLDLPYIEMLPYQRTNLTSKNYGSSGNAEGDFNQAAFDDSYSVELFKKSDLTLGDDDDPHSGIHDKAFAEEQMRKLQKRKKSTYTKEKIKTLVRNYKMESNKMRDRIKSSVSHSNTGMKKFSSNRSINIKLDEPKKESKIVQNIVHEMDGLHLLEVSKEGKSKETFRDEESLRKYRLLSKFIAGNDVDDGPEGMAYNSDCCILIPCSSVADTLYKMERMPLIIYVVELHQGCTKLVGKMYLPMDYCFQKAVIKAAKLKAGVVNHALERRFPICKTTVDGKRKVKIGNIFGSINLVCYGRFGMTEIKSTAGNLMSHNLHEYKKDNYSNGIQEEGINIFEQPYGFKPVTTRNTLPPSNRSLCPSLEPPQSMFDFIHKYHNPEDKKHRLKTNI